MIRFILLAVLITLSSVYSYTELWSGVRNITAERLIEKGDTVRVQAGTLINFGLGSTLRIKGTLIVEGTSDSPVVFQGENWMGLQFDSDESSLLSFALIKDAIIGVNLSSGQVTLFNSRITNLQKAAILARGGELVLVQSTLAESPIGLDLKMQANVRLEDSKITLCGVAIRGESSVTTRFEDVEIYQNELGVQATSDLSANWINAYFHSNGKDFSNMQSRITKKREGEVHSEIQNILELGGALNIWTGDQPRMTQGRVPVAWVFQIGNYFQSEVRSAWSHASIQDEDAQISGIAAPSLDLMYKNYGFEIQVGVTSPDLYDEYTSEEFILASTLSDPNLLFDPVFNGEGTNVRGGLFYTTKAKGAVRINTGVSYLWRDLWEVEIKDGNTFEIEPGNFIQGQFGILVKSGAIHWNTYLIGGQQTDIKVAGISDDDKIVFRFVQQFDVKSASGDYELRALFQDVSETKTAGGRLLKWFNLANGAIGPILQASWVDQNPDIAGEAPGWKAGGGVAMDWNVVESLKVSAILTGDIGETSDTPHQIMGSRSVLTLSYLF
jgi:hypothetical protein